MEVESNRLAAMDRSIETLKGYLEDTDAFLSDAGLLEFSVPSSTSKRTPSEKVD